jgi:hypothetical protein
MLVTYFLTLIPSVIHCHCCDMILVGAGAVDVHRCVPPRTYVLEEPALLFDLRTLRGSDDAAGGFVIDLFIC